MTEQTQRIAIAEACRWEYHGDKSWPKNADDYYWKIEGKVAYSILPDYPHDLNAMREAIKYQPMKIQKAMRAEVWRLSSQMDVLPEAKVFAKALLRVLGKWVESTERQSAAVS